ncbi:hypothetical protein RUND412_001026 [Rhizina undulata]
MAPKPRVSEVAKPPVSLASSCVISETASLAGTFPIRIGANSVIHPRAKLNSSAGPITIKDYCIINERTLLSASDAAGLILNDGVVIEVNSVVEGREIGEGSLLEVGVKVGRAAVVGKGCKITPLIEIKEGEVVPDNTVIFGYGERRIDNSGSAAARRKLTERHVESLRVVIASNPSKFMA